jgi:diguanylate cyclase (GGDEF)-like protein
VAFRALLVEADRPSRDVREALADTGCIEIWSATSCEAAVERFRRERLAPDVAIVDIPGPEPRSLEVLGRLRGVPVIALLDDPASDARGVDAVLRPARRIDLIARIRSALRLRAERARRAARARTLSDENRRLRRENRELERLVCVDSLTGIANRRHVLSLLEAEWKRSTRDGTPLAIIMIDLDEFHAFNARYGHPAGDACLRRAAGAMVSALRRPSDFLGRYGGEEFVAILAGTDAVGARTVAERLRTTIESLAIPHEGSSCAQVVTLSAGFAAMQPTMESSRAELLEMADAALLRAKELGRNRVEGDAPDAVPLALASGDPAEGWWNQSAPVVADPWLAARIPQFLQAVREEVRGIEVARRARDYEHIRLVARRLKAEARELGLEEIRRLAGELERAGRPPDREVIRRVATELEQYAAHVQVTYRRRTVEMAAVAPMF